MYEKRFIAFVDILGFGSLVEKSSNEGDLPKKILSALLSLQPEAIHEEAYARINVELVPPEQLQEVMFYARKMTEVFRKQHNVVITYFSDSLVISASFDDVIASQLILDLLAKLSIKLWSDHSLLIRGGLTLGDLIHIENGPLFGPAMNRAYHLESKLAKNPRILIDAHCVSTYRQIDTFTLFESYIEADGEYYYSSLGTAYRHIINDSSLALAGEKVLRGFRTSLDASHEKIAGIIQSTDNVSIKLKYQWLSSEMALRAAEVRPHEPSDDDSQ